MTGGRSLGRVEILALLYELAEELAAQSASAALFVVGGAAMSLAFDARRSTADIDAAFQPSDDVRQAAATIALRHELAADWLNDGAKGFMPGADPGATLLFERPSLRVELASAEYLLAMKIRAARVELDVDDIRTLYKILGFTTVDEGLTVAERFYGAAGMLATLHPRSRYVREGLLSPPPAEV